MQYKPETEKVAMMGGTYTAALKPLSLAEDREVQRTRKIFMIILGVCLALSVGTLIVAIFGSGIEQEGNSQRGTQVGQALISIFYYAFGLFVAHRYSELGLRIVRIACRDLKYTLYHSFAWIGVIGLVLTAIGLVFLLIVIIAGLTVGNSTDHTHQTGMMVGVAVGALIIGLICLAAFILTIIEVKFAFKLARLIDANKRLNIQQI